ncbi:MAG TPA: CBS domain-containing protein [Anaerolineales bacterium]|nr:CBS domain-containing protein [Anaerolineales bacterium]
MTRLVRDLMTPGVMTCPPNASLGKVARLLAERRVHSLFVVDQARNPIGVITDFDLLAGEWLSQDPESLLAMRRMTAGELMSTPVATIDASEPANQAACRMKDEQIRRLLVMDRARPVGVISVSDFLREMAQSAPVGRKTVGEVMSDVYMVCRDKTPVIAAARALSDTGWRSVLVVDAYGKPLGIFSGLDLLDYDCEKGLADDFLVTEVMHPALSIGIHASLRAAAQLMIENHHHRLLVQDADEPDWLPLGVISSYDIVVEMARPGSVWQE